MRAGDLAWVDFNNFYSVFSFLLVLFGIGVGVYLISQRVWSAWDRKEGKRPGNYAPRRTPVYRNGPPQIGLNRPIPPASQREARGFTYTVSPASPYGMSSKVELPAEDAALEESQIQEEHSPYAHVAADAEVFFHHDELRRMVIAKEVLQRRAGRGRR